MFNIFRRPTPGTIPAAPSPRPAAEPGQQIGSHFTLYTLHFALAHDWRRRRGGGVARERRLEFAGRATLRSAGAIGST